MEGITLGVLLGAAAVLLGRQGSGRAKGALGWAAKQAGWIAGRVQTDIADARRIAREAFERERDAAKIGDGAHTNGAPPSERSRSNGHAHVTQ